MLVIAIISGGLMAQTAHLGGQVRHTEIRNGLALQNSESGSGNEIDQQQDKDED